MNEPGAWNFAGWIPLIGGDRRDLPDRFGWVVQDAGFGHAIRVPGYADHLEATMYPNIRKRQASAGRIRRRDRGHPSF